MLPCCVVFAATVGLPLRLFWVGHELLLVMLEIGIGCVVFVYPFAGFDA